MALEVSCGNCKHRQSRNICGNSQSPHSNMKVESSDRCDFYLESPAQVYLKEGSIKSLGGDTSAVGMEDFKKALELGLPDDDAMFAQLQLVSAYTDLALAEKDKLTIEQLVASAPFGEAINQAEKVVTTDREGKYEFFTDPVRRAYLSRIDALYDLAAGVLKDDKGIDEAVRYLQQKISLFSYLPTTPLLGSSLSLGNLYAEKGQKENAAVCYQSIVSSEPVLRGDDTGVEPDIRRMAADNLRVVESKTSTESKSGCFVVTATCGSEFAEEVILLRTFRDDFLARRVSGRAFIRAYDTCGPFLARIISRSNLLRKAARTLLVEPAVKFVKSILPEGND
jgi:hypothetical protein